MLSVGKMPLNILRNIFDSNPVREMYSFSNLFISFAKEAVLPKITDFIGDLIKRVGKEQDAETAKEQEVEI